MVTLTPRGTIEFRIYLPQAQRVQILGDFTGWEAAPLDMAPAQNGWWRHEAHVPAGDYEFRYLADGRHWVTDFAAHGVSMNPFGTWNSGLAVPPMAGTLRKAA